MTRLVLLAALSACLTLHAGCGVILGYGNPQPVEVRAKLPHGEFVPGLAVRDNGNPIQDGVSGGTVLLHPSAKHQLTIADPAYRSSSQTVVRRIRIDVALLDALTLGIGLLVDYLSGSLYSLDSVVTIGVRTKAEADRLLREARTKKDRESTGTPADAGGVWVEDLDTGRKVFLPDDSKACDACRGLRGDLATCPHCGKGR